MLKPTESTYSAPRLQCWFSEIEGRRVLLMHRDKWERLRVHSGDSVEVDVSEMPIATVTSGATLKAAVAERRSDYEVVISIYRLDPADDPTPINVDKYVVWERLPDHRNFMDMVNRASTSDNANMRGFLAEHVFMVKEPPTEDHWLSELPTRVRAVVQKRGTTE